MSKHDNHTPSCVISRIAGMVDDAICEAYDATESLEARLGDGAMEQLYRIISSLELVAQSLESLAADLNEDEHCDMEGETEGRTN